MDSILSSNEELLTSGYAGSQVLSVKLDTLAESRRKKRSTDGAQSTQNATECKVGINFYNINDPQYLLLCLNSSNIVIIIVAIIDYIESGFSSD